MGWPAAAAVAYNTSVGAFIIPVCLGVNLLMLLTKTTRTVNIDLWNYWHFAFIGAVVYFASDNIWWGFFAAIICYIITLIMADYTADKFQGFYDKMEGISIPQPFCAGFVPFAVVINKALDKIPGFDKLNIDAEGMKKKFGLLGEPLFLGILVGCGIGALSCKNGQELVDKIPYILGLGIKMGAVMELIPRITALFIEGLKPISDATRELIAKKFKGAVGLNIGMSPALVIGHPATLVVSLLLIPVTILLAVILPGNQFLPLASLAGMFYLFPLVLPITKGNVVKTFIIGLVVLTIGLYFVTDLAPYFTQAAHDVYEKTQDAAVNIPAGFEGGALDFASSPFAWPQRGAGREEEGGEDQGRRKGAQGGEGEEPRSRGRDAGPRPHAAPMPARDRAAGRRTAVHPAGARHRDGGEKCYGVTKIISILPIVNNIKT